MRTAPMCWCASTMTRYLCIQRPLILAMYRSAGQQLLRMHCCRFLRRSLVSVSQGLIAPLGLMGFSRMMQRIAHTSTSSGIITPPC